MGGQSPIDCYLALISGRVRDALSWRVGGSSLLEFPLLRAVSFFTRARIYGSVEHPPCHASSNMRCAMPFHIIIGGEGRPRRKVCVWRVLFSFCKRAVCSCLGRSFVGIVPVRLLTTGWLR